MKNELVRLISEYNKTVTTLNTVDSDIYGYGNGCGGDGSVYGDGLGDGYGRNNGDGRGDGNGYGNGDGRGSGVGASRWYEE